jgi:hypothetical protein
MKVFVHATWLSLLGGLIFFAVFAQAKEKTQENSDTTLLSFPGSYMTAEAPHGHLTDEDWTDPRICGQCHTYQYEGWNGSMHSNSFKDPVFQAEWAIAEKLELGLGDLCGACHTPIGVATGSIEFHPDRGVHGEFTASPVAEMGVSCDVCHTISGSNMTKTAVLEHGNASFVMSPGNVKRAGLQDAESPYHDTQYSEHHTKADFCGNCHNIFHPVNNFPIERTYDEWKYSIYAQNDIQCQDCHMMPVEVGNMVADQLLPPEKLEGVDLGGFVALGGPWREVRHRHGFVGGNAVLTAAMNAANSDNPEDLGRGTNYDEAIKRLQSVASLQLSVDKVDPNSLHRVNVRVTNERAGHNLPTSLVDVRQVWIEVVVTDDKGNELLRNGTLDENNEVPKDSTTFGAHSVDAEGNNAEFPWEIARFTDVTTIPPKGHKYGRYFFNVPADVQSINVVAKLHYRSFSQYLADKVLGKDAVAVPSVEMVVLEESFPVGAIKTASIAAEQD